MLRTTAIIVSAIMLSRPEMARTEAEHMAKVLRQEAKEHGFEPVKLNFLTLGNWVPHLHTHVLPRYRDDPAPGGPIPWDAIFTSEPTSAETLRRQAAALRARLIRA